MSYIDDKKKIMKEIEKKVATELEKIITREMERTGLSRYDAYTKNKAMVLKLKKQYEEKFMLEHPLFKAMKEKELEESERTKEIERHRQEKEVEYAKALIERANKEKIKKEKNDKKTRVKFKKEFVQKQKEKEKMAHVEWIRKTEEKRLQDNLAKGLSEQHEKNMYQKILRQELEREKEERSRLVAKSRANTVFSDDLIEKEDEFEFEIGIAGEAWLREEELYLISLVKKGVSIEDIAYLLDRSVGAVRRRLSFFLKGDLT